MSSPESERISDLEDVVLRPGTYFNPQTEVIVVVDDSSSIDQEVFNLDEFEATDWVRISDDVPIEESSLEHAIEDFQTSYHPTARAAVSATRSDHGDDEIVPDEDLEDLEPDPDPEG